MDLVILALAAISYVVGGMAMKWSNGFANIPATLGVFAAFLLGSALQTYGMKFEALGVGYVLVLGLEAIFAVFAGILFFQEGLPIRNAVGVTFVIVGMVLLKGTH